LALVVAVALMAPTIAQGAVPPAFFGVQAWSTPDQVDFHSMAAAKVGTYRAIFDWSAVEPVPGARDWGSFDVVVARAASAGMDVLPVMIGSPPFAAPRPQYPPLRSAQGRTSFAAFLRDAAGRYGPSGSFWSANPGLPYRPIRSWQIWNEPNLPAYWFGRPKVRAYVQLLALARQALRGSDPRARIVLAGIPESRYPGALGMEQFYRQLYSVRGARSDFDVAAIHPYAGDERGLLDALRRVHVVMARHGDGRAPLWVTEMGWATGGNVTANTRRFKTSPAGQAKRLSRAFHALLQARGRYHVGMVVWFSWRDRPRAPGERDWWAIHTGLLDILGKPKPAWLAYQRLAR
jgi:hypothetical protein